MRFPRLGSVLLNLGPVSLNSVPVITSVPGNQARSYGQNSVKTVPNTVPRLVHGLAATGKYRVTSKRPKNKSLFHAHSGSQSEASFSGRTPFWP